MDSVTRAIRRLTRKLNKSRNGSVSIARRDTRRRERSEDVTTRLEDAKDAAYKKGLARGERLGVRAGKKLAKGK